MAVIEFLGAAGTVTGSRFLVAVDGKRILVDCGLFQGVKELRLKNREPFPVDPRSIDAVLLTHAHLDHSGYLPLLVRQGFRGPVYVTLPTRSLAEILLLDAGNVQEQEAREANERGYTRHAPAQPLFTVEDARASLGFLRAVDADRWHSLGEGLRFRFTTSGHILGSAFIELRCSEGTLVISGDVGRRKPLLLSPPRFVAEADWLVVESTYGDRCHPADAPVARLERVIGETIDRGGTLLIPTFAIGRAQDVLYLLRELRRRKKLGNLPVYIDSPMAIEATRVYEQHPAWHELDERGIRDLYDGTIPIQSERESAALLRGRKPKIILAGAGMLTGGRILAHLRKHLPDERSTVLLVGYQAPGTRGRLLRDGAAEVKIHGEYVRVEARVEEIAALSAHADQKELLQWLRGFRRAPRRTFIVHGEPQASDALRLRIRDFLGWEAHVPTFGEKITL